MKDTYNQFFKNLPQGYKWIKIPCLCGNKYGKIIANKDRFDFNLNFLICKYCGLVRAEKFLDENSLKDFYENHYTNLYSENYFEPHEMYNFQVKHSKDRNNIIQKHFKNLTEKKNVLDLGGAAGGNLHQFLRHNCYLADYDMPYLKIAEKKGINIILGGIDEIIKKKLKFDLVLLNHVVEHIVDLNKFFEKLKIILNNDAIVFIEFPALDSLKLQRATDFKDELHIPHVYYFTSYYMKEFIQRFGFKLLYLDQYSRIACRFNIKNHRVSNYSFSYIKTRKDIFLGNFCYYIKCSKISEKIKRYIYSLLNRI